MKRQRTGEDKRNERERLWENLGTSGLCFQWDCVLFCSSRHILTRTWKGEQGWKVAKKMDLCKVPGVKFLWNKNLSVLFYFQLQSLFPFFSGVLVNGHLYVNMKNQDQVLIDGLLENHVGLAFV